MAADLAHAMQRQLPCLQQSPQRIGLILGSGLHGVADQIEDDQRVAYVDLPGLSETTADGHVGEFVAGVWHDFPVLAMNGRFHLYEGFSIEQITLPIRAMRQLGIQHLIISNAAGGLNPSFRSGDVMLIEQHVDLTFRRASGAEHRTSADLYDTDWQCRFLTRALQFGIPLQRGTYVGLTGPTYETRAEYRFLRDFVGDAVGMSTVCEAQVAAQCGLRVIGLSVITNVASPDVARNTSSAEVLEVAGNAEELVEQCLDIILACAPSRPPRLGPTRTPWPR